MSIEKLTDDLNIISSLGDNPNTDDGLTADELKKAFDKGPLRIQQYLNDVIVPAVEQVSESVAGIESGKSAYEIAVENGFEGTEAEWLESLPGEDGTDSGSAVESEDYPGCYYRTDSDGNKLWINPPMVPGEYYDTTEMFNGAPVRVMAFQETLGSNTSETFPYPPLASAATGKVIGIQAGLSFPDIGACCAVPFYASTSSYCRVEVSGTNLVVGHGSVAQADGILSGVIKWVP